jgi:hypothetical protein
MMALGFVACYVSGKLIHSHIPSILLRNSRAMKGQCLHPTLEVTDYYLTW